MSPISSKWTKASLSAEESDGEVTFSIEVDGVEFALQLSEDESASLAEQFALGPCDVKVCQPQEGIIQLAIISTYLGMKFIALASDDLVAIEQLEEDK